EQTLTWLQLSEQHHIITLADENYPKILLNISDPPTIIYARGNIELLNHQGLAVVGSRNATPQGLLNAENFCQVIANFGLPIISGLALGIDSAAHKGALKADNGATLAVIGTGINRMYPASNKNLALQILEQNGLIITEFPLNTSPSPENFPRRNRLISGLSLGILVVEATIDSGSLITAKLAAEQGREVFAIPGSIHSPLSKGCHKLIRQGAKLVETANDILEELRFKPYVPNIKKVEPKLVIKKENIENIENNIENNIEKTEKIENDKITKAKATNKNTKTATKNKTKSKTTNKKTAKNIINKIESNNENNNDDNINKVLNFMGYSPCTLDELVERTNISAAEILTHLLTLEMQGKISTIPGGSYQRLN
ncbi:MAG: DNA-processing protein DprA, partial [Rhodocyclaceae bacterium]